MPTIAKYVLAFFAAIVACILMTSISVLIFMTSKPADRKTRMDNARRAFAKMIYGAKMLIKN